MGEEERKLIARVLRGVSQADRAVAEGLCGNERKALLDVAAELSRVKKILYSFLTVEDVAAEGVPDEG